MKCEAPPLVVSGALVKQESSYFFKGVPFTGGGRFSLKAGLLLAKSNFLMAKY